MLGNHLFQSICLESVHLKTDRQFFQNVGMLHPAGTMHYKAVGALCIVEPAAVCNPLSAELLPWLLAIQGDVACMTIDTNIHKTWKFKLVNGKIVSSV
jgi:hypothetical protein